MYVYLSINTRIIVCVINDILVHLILYNIMDYISYNKLWESEFDGKVSKRDKLLDLYINQLKLEVHVSFKKDEKVTTKFEPINDSDVINKSYLDEN